MKYVFKLHSDLLDDLLTLADVFFRLFHHQIDAFVRAPPMVKPCSYNKLRI